MADTDTEVYAEELTSNDLINCLWSKDAAEKCRLGVTDTVVYEKGVPVSWFYTGKTGEVLKKRHVDMNSVSARWRKIGNQFNDVNATATLDRSQPVAILRQQGKLTKFLGLDAFETMIMENAVKPDDSIVALHCFVQGVDKTLYRNKFTIKDSLGRFVTSTQSYVFKSRNTMPDALQVYQEKDMVMTESKVQALRNIMDLATSTVVRYIEKMLNCRVLSLSVDYAIDKRSQLWMLWSNDIWIARTSNLCIVTNWFGRSSNDPNARMSWAGLKFQESYREMEEEGRPYAGISSTGASVAATGSLTTTSGLGNNNRETLEQQARRLAHYSGTPKNPVTPLEVATHRVSVNSGSEQVYDAMTAVMESKSSQTFKAKANVLQTHVMLPAGSNGNHEHDAHDVDMSAEGGGAEGAGGGTTAGGKSGSATGRGRRIDSTKQRNFPDSLRCRGDYCNVQMHPVGPLFIDPEVRSVHSDTPIGHFFSNEELAKLRKKANFNEIMSNHWGAVGNRKPGDDTVCITMKSLILARRERRGVFAKNVNKDSWREFPLTPRHSATLRSHLNQLRMDGSLPYDDDSEMSMELRNLDMQLRRSNDDVMLEKLEKEKDFRESFTKTLPQYYEEVRVCQRCFHIYHLLDWAREALGDGGVDPLEAGSGAQRKGTAGGDAGRRASAKASAQRKRNGAGSPLKTVATGVLTEPGPENPEGMAKPIPYGRQSVPIPANQLPTQAQLERSSSSSGPRRGGPLKSASTPQLEPLATSASFSGTAALESTNANTANSVMTTKSGKVTWKDYSVGPEKPTSKGGRRKGRGGAGATDGEPEKFADLDDYLRGGAQALASRKAREKEELVRTKLAKLTAGSATFVDPDDPDKLHTTEKSLENLYHGNVLFACPEHNEHAAAVVAHLEQAYFAVYWIKDGRAAVNELLYRMDGLKYDAVLIDRHLPLDDALIVTAAVRDEEREERQRVAKKMAARGRGGNPKVKRMPMICFTNETAPDDLKCYMKADMDGCVSFPVNKVSLLDTIRAAIPHHLAEIQPKKVHKGVVKLPDQDPLDEIEEYENELKNAKINEGKVFKLNNLGVMEGSTDSATMAAATLPVSQALEEDYSYNGVVQIDADTRIPYMVLDASKTAKVVVNPKRPFFNLVVCHDLFDTAEKMKIFFKPIIERYLGMQVLVWNYPGQAFTEFRSEQLLNNEYHAIVLNELLGQVGSKGTCDFDTDKPFYLLGYGFGVSIASFYLAHFRVPNVRGMLNVNGWAYLDSYLAGVVHDCVNVFQATPPSRPDLPVYFFSRFLFCKDYLAKVSVPLALNIYTAIHNPISAAGRLQLCKGVLQTVDMRSLLKEIDIPMICIQSTQDSFVRPLHVEPFVHNRNGEAKSIHSALQNPDKTCIIWVKSGHELFQETKKQTQLLFEQILTGFHENHEVGLAGAADVDRVAVQQGLVTVISSQVGTGGAGSDNARSRKHGKTVEDSYINNIIGTMNTVSSSNRARTPTGGSMSAATSSSLPPLNNLNQSSVASNFGPGTAGSINYENSMFDSGAPGSAGPRGSVSRGKQVVFNANDPSTWEKFSQTISEGQNLGFMAANKKKSKKGENDPKRTFDPSLRAFERQDSVVYGKKDKSTNPAEYDEIKEYMGWRLKRNKKRLQRLQGATRIIQSAFRAYLARQFVKGIRRRKAAMCIQRAFRGWIGRCSFIEQARRIWAAQRIQRAYRGYLGRKFYFFIRLRIAAAANIQRVFRGHKARVFVDMKRKRRYYAACKIQALFRRNLARKMAFRKRYERNSAICIQRIFRGHLGKKKSLSERDKFIFSRSQTQGIEFGRQMLLEHKLHATKLQSDVTLLMQEKVSAEEMVEALLDEISSFEGGVRTLEKEMHQLSKVESEAAAYMDEESKYELREQKIRLDKEFGDMLAKIANRKEMLTDLESKLNTIDKTRQGKEEELRTLERKLVVLLEEQQNELNAIKRKQDIRGAMLAASHAELANASAAGGNSTALVVANAKGGAGGSAGAGAATGGGGGKAIVAAGGGGSGGPSVQDKKQAAQLMQSTETLMKFGFMSMSMTYFSSLNMIKALRTVSAQDTVMAALSDVHSQRAAGFGTEGGGGGGGGEGKMSKGTHLPNLKAGQLPGQEQLRVSAWSVDDVSKWLQTLSLGQYCEAFIDAAIDGEFLYDINDDDLKNTLGIEHRLHRKKILSCVHRLKVAEALEDSRLEQLLKETGAMEQARMEDEMKSTEATNPFINNPAPEGATTSGGTDRRIMDGPKIPLVELFSLVRHSKISLIKEALDYLPNKKFDKSLVSAPYVLDHGTVYVDGYEKLTFHINKTDDEFGNTMLMIACQSGNMKIVKYLVAKGANPNAQNKMGQTPAHFAISFKFYDISQWLFENGADDTLCNKFGLTPYDGLLPEGMSGFDDDNEAVGDKPKLLN